MARDKFYSVTETPYSKWHRSQHDGIAYQDIDKVSICPACAQPLFIADTIYNYANSCKPKSDWMNKAYIYIAKQCNIPFFVIWYSVDENDDRKVYRIDVQKIYPKKSAIRSIQPEEWLQFLEFKVKEHIPNCKEKKYLLERVTRDTPGNKTFKRKNEYVEILSNRSKNI